MGRSRVRNRASSDTIHGRPRVAVVDGRQPSITTFFADPSGSRSRNSSLQDPVIFPVSRCSSRDQSPCDRKHELESDSRTNTNSINERLSKRVRQTALPRTPLEKPDASHLCLSSTNGPSYTSSTADVFAIPVVKSGQPCGRQGAIPPGEDLVPEEGEEFVRPPELEEGEDDDFWDNASSSGSSVTLKGESVVSISDDDDDSKLEEKQTRRVPHQTPQKVSETTCPICDMVLTGTSLFDAEKHVNECLDGDTHLNKASVSKRSSMTASFPARSQYEIQSASGSSSKVKLPQPQAMVQKNAFGALMKGKTEEHAWKLSEQDSNPRHKGKSVSNSNKPSRAPLTAPFYKIMEGTTIAVDAFKYGKIPGITAYFLSHAHADHYTRLSHTWDHGLVYCSQTTANLICHNLGVKKVWVRPLKNDEPTMVDGVRVTLLDANHCPGSSLFLFEGVKQPQGNPFRYLHCGDFRASPAHLRHPALKDKKVDICYLDTTYLSPKYCFPAQEQVINACADLVRSRIVETDKTAMNRSHVTLANRNLVKSGAMLKDWLTGQADVANHDDTSVSDSGVLAVPIQKESPSKTIDIDEPKFARIFRMASKADLSKSMEESVLILIGTYTIGKERIVKQIAKSIGSKIYCDTRKSLIFKCIEDPELHRLMTDDPFKAQVHVTNLFAIKHEMLEEYLQRFRGHFTHIIGLRPTGWTYKPEKAKTATSALPSVAKVLDMFSPVTRTGTGNESGSTPSEGEFTQTCLYPQRDSTERCQAFGVPYSEHSSFFELTCFCVSMDWVRIIPTVNCGSAASRAKMKVWFERWHAERKRRIDANLPLFIEPRAENYW